MIERLNGIRNVDLDLPSQVEYNRAKNVEQDSKIETMNSQLSTLLAQAPAGFLPRVFYGLTRGNQTYRFTADAEISQALTGTDGDAFELYSNNESDNNYIAAVAVKIDDSTIKIIIQGDYTVDSSSFKAVNMTTGNSENITLSGVLSLQNASSLSDYPAVDNKEKQITVINNLENNSKNVIFASLDINSDGTYNWVEIGNFVDGVDGLSVRSVNLANFYTVLAQARVNDTLLFAERISTSGGDDYYLGDLYNVDAVYPNTALTYVGNIRGAQGEQGIQGNPGTDGADGETPYIQDGYWYIGETNTGVKAIGTDGADGQNGQAFQTQSGLYSVPSNWGASGNVDPDGNALNQLPTLPTTGITGKGYVVYDPLTTPLAPFYDLYWANDGDNSWSIIHPFSGIAGTNGTDGETPYISGGTWWIGSTNTGVAATGPQGPAGPGVPSGGTAGQVLTKVDGTDYNTAWQTASGGSLYMHNIMIMQPQSLNGNIYLTLYTSSSTPLSSRTLLGQYLYSIGIDGSYDQNYISASGYYKDSNNHYMPFLKMYGKSDGRPGMFYATGDSSGIITSISSGTVINNGTVYDTVTQI